MLSSFSRLVIVHCNILYGWLCLVEGIADLRPQLVGVVTVQLFAGCFCCCDDRVVGDLPGCLCEV